MDNKDSHESDIEVAINFAARGRDTFVQAVNTEDQTKLKKAIVLLAQSKDLIQDHPARAGILAHLGLALWFRFEHTEDLDDLNNAIDVSRQAVEASPQDLPDRSTYLSYLGVALQTRFMQTHRVEDLDEAVTSFHQAVDSLLSRFEHSGQNEALDAAFTSLRQAIEATPRHHPYRPLYLTTLALSLHSRFEITERVEDLDESIEVGRQAVDAASPDDPARSLYWENLGLALRSRSQRTDQGEEDLQEAVMWLRKAVAATPPDESARAQFLADLGIALRLRSERVGQTRDLDEAIEVGRQAVRATSSGDSSRFRYWADLGTALQIRFEWIGRTQDLDEAIEAGCQAVGVTSSDDLARPQFSENLGIALHLRFQRIGRMEDLDEAVRLLRASVDISPQHGPGSARKQTNLGSVLLRRFQLIGGMEDLHEAVTLFRQAAEATPERRPDRPLRLSNLGVGLRTRFEKTEQVQDLDEAVTVFRQAVDATSQDHPTLPAFLINLGSALWLQFQLNSRGEALDEAVTLFRRAAGVASAPVDVRVDAARLWGRSAALGQHWAEAVEGYSTAVELAGLMVVPDLGRADQEHRLTLLTGLGPEAAAACLQAGLPDRAVEMFEHGRAVLFSQTLEARFDVTALEKEHPELAERFVRWRHELDHPGSLRLGLSAELLSERPLEGVDTGAAVPTGVDRLREAAELDQVLEEIRSCPGFEGFLKPRHATELLRAAAQGPVVLLNVAQLRSDALVLTCDGIEVLPLAEVDAVKVVEQLALFMDALDQVDHLSEATRAAAEASLAGVLEWLGERVTGPVLDHLGYTALSDEDTVWPRVWWCPSGALSLLPLHAAGHHQDSDGPSDAVIDRVMSSTAPTVRALLFARRTPPPNRQRMLVVAMPHTPEQPDLPGATKEADLLRTLYEGRTTVLGLPGTDPATYDSVLDSLTGHPVVHFACHGESDLDNPSASHLLLEDYQTRPLTVLDLIAAHVQYAEMAFLSACTTARNGARLPDEPIHLAAACQLAGYRHVIASLWPISDNATARLTEHFYTTYTQTFAAGDAVASALHRATRDLRSDHNARPSTWAPYTHTGP